MGKDFRATVSQKDQSIFPPFLPSFLPILLPVLLSASLRGKGRTELVSGKYLGSTHELNISQTQLWS